MLVCADDAARGRELRELLLTVQPSAVVAMADVATLAEGELPDAEVGIVDVGDGSVGGIECVRTLRARGFSRPIIVVADEPCDEALTRAATVFGIGACLTRRAATAEPLRLAGVVAASIGAGPDSPAMRDLARTRRLIAAGEQALRLQHDINNPLAGLLAEVQLLQLEELTVEQRASTDRILTLCRRIVGLVRRLDALTAAPAGEVKV